MKKVAILLPDFFWSSIPYDGLTLYHEMIKSLPVDLIMFKNDIRLNKTERRTEDRFEFNSNLFRVNNLRVVEKWTELVEVSREYALMLSPSHLAAKGRTPEFEFPDTGFKFKHIFKKVLGCPLMVWDIGGTDIFTTHHRATYLCVKGQLWKDWLVSDGIPAENIFVTGTPHYDYYHSSDKIFPVEARPISTEKFRSKYNLGRRKKCLLVTPSNPASHREQFDANMKHMEKLVALCHARGYQMLIKTYPSDYLFYETGGPFTGIYHRICGPQPMYDFLAAQHPGVRVVDSQDHFAALLHSKKLFNMSGSHIAWETYFSPCIAYSMNYKNQPYYGRADYLPKAVWLPDDNVNVHVDNIEDVFDDNKKPDKNCAPYMSAEFSLPNIRAAVESILDRK